MYDDESKNGIIIYTVVFFFLLASFIGFLLYKGVEDGEKSGDNSKVKKRALIRSSN